MHDPTTPQTAKPSWHRARLWASLGWVALGLSLGGATCRETKIDKTQNEAHYNLAVYYATQQPPTRELARWHYRKAVELDYPKSEELEKLIARN